MTQHSSQSSVPPLPFEINHQFPSLSLILIFSYTCQLLIMGPLKPGCLSKQWSYTGFESLTLVRAVLPLCGRQDLRQRALHLYLLVCGWKEDENWVLCSKLTPFLTHIHIYIHTPVSSFSSLPSNPHKGLHSLTKAAPHFNGLSRCVGSIHWLRI